MAFTKNYMNELFVTVLVLSALLSTASAVDCHGKSFHCVNSTHFMICVDLGGGVSQAIDNFYIACPPPTICQGTNHFECEFPTPTTLATTANNVISETTLPWEEIVTASSLGNTTKEFSENYMNTERATTAEYSITTDTTVDVTASTASGFYISNDFNVTNVVPTVPETTSTIIETIVSEIPKSTLSDINTNITQATVASITAVNEQATTTESRNSTKTESVFTGEVSKVPTVETTTTSIEYLPALPIDKIDTDFYHGSTTAPSKLSKTTEIAHTSAPKDRPAILELEARKKSNVNVKDPPTDKVENIAPKIIQTKNTVDEIITTTETRIDSSSPKKSTTHSYGEIFPEITVTTGRPLVDNNKDKINNTQGTNVTEEPVVISSNSQNPEATTTIDKTLTTETAKNEEPTTIHEETNVTTETAYIPPDSVFINDTIDIAESSKQLNTTNDPNLIIDTTQNVFAEAIITTSENSMFGSATIIDPEQITTEVSSLVTMTQKYEESMLNGAFIIDNNVIGENTEQTMTTYEEPGTSDISGNAVILPSTISTSQTVNLESVTTYRPMSISSTQSITQTSEDTKQDVTIITEIIDHAVNTEYSTKTNKESSITEFAQSITTESIIPITLAVNLNKITRPQNEEDVTMITHIEDKAVNTEHSTKLNTESFITDTTQSIITETIIPHAVNLDMITKPQTSEDTKQDVTMTTQSIDNAVDTEYLYKTNKEGSIMDETQSITTENIIPTTHTINLDMITKPQNWEDTKPDVTTITQSTDNAVHIEHSTKTNKESSITEVAQSITTDNIIPITLAVNLDTITKPQASEDTKQDVTMITQNIDNAVGTEHSSKTINKSSIMDETQSITTENIIPTTHTLNLDMITRPHNSEYLKPDVTTIIQSTDNAVNTEHSTTNKESSIMEFAQSITTENIIPITLAVNLDTITNPQLSEDTKQDVTMTTQIIDNTVDIEHSSKTNNKSSIMDETQSITTENIISVAHTINLDMIIKPQNSEDTKQDITTITQSTDNAVNTEHSTETNKDSSITEFAQIITTESIITITEAVHLDTTTRPQNPEDIKQAETTNTPIKDNYVNIEHASNINEESYVVDTLQSITADNVIPSTHAVHLDMITRPQKYEDIKQDSPTNALIIDNYVNTESSPKINEQRYITETSQSITTDHIIPITHAIYSDMLTRPQNSENTKQDGTTNSQIIENGAITEQTFRINEESPTTMTIERIATENAVPIKHKEKNEEITPETVYGPTTMINNLISTDSHDIITNNSESVLTQIPRNETFIDGIFTTETVNIVSTNISSFVNGTETETNNVPTETMNAIKEDLTTENQSITENIVKPTNKVTDFNPLDNYLIDKSNQNSESKRKSSEPNVQTQENEVNAASPHQQSTTLITVSSTNYPRVNNNEQNNENIASQTGLQENIRSLFKNDNSPFSAFDFLDAKDPVTLKNGTLANGGLDITSSPTPISTVTSAASSSILNSIQKSYQIIANFFNISSELAVNETNNNVKESGKNTTNYKDVTTSNKDTSVVSLSKNNENKLEKNIPSAVSKNDNIDFPVTINNKISGQSTIKRYEQPAATQDSSGYIPAGISTKHVNDEVDKPMLDILPLHINDINFSTSFRNIQLTDDTSKTLSDNTVIVTESYKQSTLNTQNGVIDEANDITKYPISSGLSSKSSPAGTSEKNNDIITVNTPGDDALNSATGFRSGIDVSSQQVEQTPIITTSSSNKVYTISHIKPTESINSTATFNNILRSIDSDNVTVEAPQEPVQTRNNTKSNILREANLNTEHQKNNSSVTADLKHTPQNSTTNKEPEPNNLPAVVSLSKNTTQKIYITTARTSSQSVTANPISATSSNINKQVTNDAAAPYTCINGIRGRYSDKDDCRKFYICIGNHEPIVGNCPESTVFSDLKKQCTKNLSHCIRGNEFKCPSAGRFIDFMKDNVYYVCVNFKSHLYKFKFQCQKGFVLNKTTVTCIETKEIESNESVSISSGDSNSQSGSVSVASSSTNGNSISTSTISSSSSDSDDSRSKKKYSSKTRKSKEVEETPEEPEEQEEDEEDEVFKCKKEGKFPIRNECRRYYLCKKNRKSEYRRKIKKCNSGKVFHKDKKKCVDDDSYEC